MLENKNICFEQNNGKQLAKLESPHKWESWKHTTKHRKHTKHTKTHLTFKQFQSCVFLDQARKAHSDTDLFSIPTQIHTD